MRVLHCPTSVGGHPNGLSKAERVLGVNSVSVTYKPSTFGHSCDECLYQDHMSFIRKEFMRWKLLFRAYFCFDVIHYNFGASILRWNFSQKISRKSKMIYFFLKGYVNFCYAIEHRLLKNKIIAITYQGDDARQSDFSQATFKYSIAQEVDSSYYSTESDQQKRMTIKKFDQIADVIYALNPDLLHVLPSRSKFLPYAHIDLNEWAKVEHPRSKIPIVLHAPSHSGAKGTRFILDAVNLLKKDGVKFEFVLVENMLNTEAKKLYEQCDLVIDQLLAGWYGGFAVEAMALGKPVICYIREEDTCFIPVDIKKDLPFIQATPDTIYNTLREWITHRLNELPIRGLRSRTFVEQWHDPVKIAASVIKDYTLCDQTKNFY